MNGRERLLRTFRREEVELAVLETGLGRLRAGSGRLYSGYSSVMGFRKRCLKVVAKPIARAFIASNASFIDTALPFFFNA